MDEVDKDFVGKRVEEGNSHAVISEELQTMFPGLRGLRERSVRRFCTDRDVSRRCSLTNEELERCVSDAVKPSSQYDADVDVDVDADADADADDDVVPFTIFFRERQETLVSTCLDTRALSAC